MVSSAIRVLVLVSFAIAFAEPELDQPLINEEDQLNEDVIDERQTCPNPTTCPPNAAPCTAQNCGTTGRCCLDYTTGFACCWPVGTGPVTTAAPTSTVGLCRNSKYGNNCRGTCTRSSDCRYKERCCRTSANVTPCCVYSGFFGV